MNAIILSIALLAPLPDGPLPWGIPVLPPVPTSSAPDVTLDEMEHSDDFEDREAAIEGQIDGWSEPVTEFSATVGVWIGDDGLLPDASEGDFTIGMAPLDEVGSAYDLAHWLGEHIGTLFEYIRAVLTLPGDVVGTIAIAAVLCATLLLFLKIFVFGLSVFDAAWSFGTTIIGLLGEYLPTGG